MMEEDKEEFITEEEIPVDLLLEIKQKIFEYECGLFSKDEIRNTIVTMTKESNMSPFYETLCDKFSWQKDETLLQAMKAANEVELQKLEDKKKDAEENLGETEVHETMLEIANFYHRIGDKEKCLKQMDEVSLLIKGTGRQLDLIFQRIRLGLVFGDTSLVKDNIEKAREILKKEGDWERRNRLKVYEGLQYIITRDFRKAATTLLESVATFSCYELMDFKKFIFYTVFVSIPTLSRQDLRVKVVENPEVLSVLADLPEIGSLLHALFYCKYENFFVALDSVCELMRRNTWLADHINYYYRELRILAFKQFLVSYRSVTLEKMAGAFAIPPKLLDDQLCCFIAANRLNCKIDKVSGQVITARYDSKNANYQSLLKNGDLLLNNIQKLARIVGT